MNALVRLFPALICAGLGASACGDDTGGQGASGSGGDLTSSGASPTTGTDATSSTGDGGGAPTSSSVSGAGGEACVPPATEGPECDFPEPGESEPQLRPFEVFEGTVVTVDGEPVTNDPIQVCGINLCLYGDTDASGSVVVPQGATQLDVPIFKVGDGLERAKLGYSLPGDELNVRVDATTIDLVDSETTLQAGATCEADGVILTIAAEAGVGLNILDFGDCGQDTFRAAVVPGEFIEVMAPGQDFVALVGLGPHETLFCPPAGLAIPNDAGLEPGTEVELVQQSLQTGQYFGNWGEWQPVATGRVADDGALIVTDEGEGIPVISPTGVRARP